MRKKAFEFLKQLINSRHIGDIIIRAELVNMLLHYYKPGPKDSCNSTIRSTASPTVLWLVKRGTLERIGRGKYKILKHIPESLTYKDISYEYRKRKAY